MDKKQKLVIYITILIMVLILGIFSFISYKINLSNKKLKEGNIDIVIYQKDNNLNDVEIYRKLFTKNLYYNEVINSVISPGNNNEVLIENGVCILKNTTCPTHSCESYRITLVEELINSTSISCLPNGLFIVLEEHKE